jgi:phosphoglycolate phosphatase
MPRLVLWDVDHTLIENGGVSKQIYASAFGILTDRPAVHAARTEGRTDQEIMVELLQAHAAPVVPWPQIEAALNEAGVRHQRRLLERGRVLPGVREVVAALASAENTLQTVVTGNTRANASLKLETFGLLPWFDLEIGAYGSDDSERSRLVALARMRTVKKYGGSFAPDAATVVIGDTPRDVEAARVVGVAVLAVATGIHGVHQLRAAGAEHVMSDLHDIPAVVRFVRGLTNV